MKAKAIELLSANYGADYAQNGSVSFAKFVMIWDESVRRGYSVPEFQAALNALVESCAYPTWTLADFLKAERPTLRSAAWRNDLIHQGKATEADFDAYKVGTTTGWCFSPPKPYPNIKCVVRRGVSLIAPGPASPAPPLAPATATKKIALAPEDRKTLDVFQKNLDLIVENNALKKEIAHLRTLLSQQNPI